LPDDGFEISYQQPFVFLPGLFSNFGVIINYTYVDAQVDYLGVVGGETSVVRPDESLIDPSENTSNLTLYYEATVAPADIVSHYHETGRQF
jgi:iron complex outermembrane receptor protein